MINKNCISTNLYEESKNILYIDFLRCLYLIFGDGSYVDKLYFSNKIPELHNYVIDIMSKLFEISKKEWKLRILHHQINNINLIQKVKNYWLSSLNFSETQIYPTVSYAEFKTAKQGNARTELGNRIYSKIVKSLIFRVNDLIKNSKLNEKQLLAIFDGILNAEGSALIDKIGLHKIVITVNQHEKNLIKVILKQLGLIEYFKESKQSKLVCSSWENFYKFFDIWIKNDMQPFSLHPRRYYNVITGFLNHERTVSLRCCLEAIENNPGQSFKEIAENLSYRRSSVSKQIRKLRKFFIIKGKGVSSYPYHVYLSNEGKNLLFVINQVRVLKIKALELLDNYNEQLQNYEVN